MTKTSIRSCSLIKSVANRQDIAPGHDKNKHKELFQDEICGKSGGIGLWDMTKTSIKVCSGMEFVAKVCVLALGT